MSIMVDQRWTGAYGIARFSHEVCQRLTNIIPLPVDWRVLHPAELWATSTALWKSRPDVFFSPGFNPPLSCPCPFVFTIHDLIHLRCLSEESESKRLWQQTYYAAVVRPAARRAFRVLTVSEFSKSQICEWANIPSERVIVVGNGVGPEFSPDGVRIEGDRYLLYVGNQKPHKNTNRLIQAFAASKIDRSIHLVLTGKPSAATTRVIEELHLSQRVRHVGEIPESQLPKYLRSAIALVFPSLYEGFGLPPLEAMACGTPVIAADSTSIPEVVGDSAMLINPHDVESLSDAIQQVVEDEGLRNTLRLKGIARAKQFNWDRTARLVNSVLGDALSHTKNSNRSFDEPTARSRSRSVELNADGSTRGVFGLDNHQIQRADGQ